MMKLKCEYCGKAFYADRCAKYDSPACRQAAYRARKMAELNARKQTLTIEEYVPYQSIVYNAPEHETDVTEILLVTPRENWLMVLGNIEKIMIAVYAKNGRLETR